MGRHHPSHLRRSSAVTRPSQLNIGASGPRSMRVCTDQDRQPAPFPPKVRFATDSSLEGAGFEPPVPRSRNAIPLWRKGTGEGSRRRQEAVPRQRVPEAGPHGAPRAAASVRLSAEGVTPICDAAARKLRLSATATNAVRSARSARRTAEFLSAPNETISDIHLGYWTTHKGSKVQMPPLGCHRRPIRS